MRVIAGSARGRPLRAPATADTRPTGDKIKGVIFSILEAEAYRRGFEPDEGASDEDEARFAVAVAWPRVLELYAGSGSLAIEALSRGAAHADLVESSAEARKAIAANLARSGLEGRATVRAMTSQKAASTLTGPYDLILLDPPYGEGDVPALLSRLVNRDVVSPSGVTAWEHRRSAEVPDVIVESGSSAGWQRVKTNAHGTVAVSLYVMADPG